MKERETIEKVIQELSEQAKDFEIRRAAAIAAERCLVAYLKTGTFTIMTPDGDMVHAGPLRRTDSDTQNAYNAIARAKVLANLSVGRNWPHI